MDELEPYDRIPSLRLFFVCKIISMHDEISSSELQNQRKGTQEGFLIIKCL